MAGLLLIAAAVASALLVASSLRLPSLISTLLVAYLAYAADLTLTTLVLSPFRGVTRPGLALVQTLVFIGAFVAWWLRGRARPPLASAKADIRGLVHDPITVAFVALVIAALAYELVLGLTVPANDYDGLAYHLARVAAWTQHGGYFWIPNAPYDPMNEYPAIAEQQILFYFAAATKGALLTLPQFTAELAILAAVYGTARRLGYQTRAAAGAACLFATFGLVGLEATTSQNDLVAASFPIVAACLLLGPSRLEHALAGVATGIGLGVKLTTVLVLPVLLGLAILRGRRATKAAVAGAVAAFVTLSSWVFVLNIAHTGRLLGHGGGRVGDEASPSYPGSVVSALDVLYTTMDLSALSNHLIGLLALAGLAAAVCVVATAVRRDRIERALAGAARVAIPFVAPLLVIGGGGVLAWIARKLGYPIRGPGGSVGAVNRRVNSGVSAFGPLGAVALYGSALLTFVTYLARRVDPRQFALAFALPAFLVLLVAQSKWNPYLPRFFLVPAALTAPLLARLFRGRAVTAAYLIVGATVLALTVTHDKAKPLASAYGRPWQLTQVQALTLVEREDAPMLTAYDGLVPAHACVGAALGQDEPSYVLFGPRLQRDVVFLPAPERDAGSATLEAAYRSNVSYVVISRGFGNLTPANLAPVADEFTSAGWKVRPLGGYWLLATAPHIDTGSCKT